MARLLDAEKLGYSVDALMSLEARDRRILEMRVLEHREFEEIALRLGMTPESVRKAFQRAQSHFRDFMSRYSSTMVQQADSNTYRPRTRAGALRAIQSLPREYADALEAHLHQGLTPPTVAALLGVPLEEADRRLARGQELLLRKYGFRTVEEFQALLRRGA
jgi:DNA-directed RNA polymerase specialized sigma24 family protein